MVRITIKKARDKQGIVPGFYIVSRPKSLGGDIRVAGKGRAKEIAEASRRIKVKRK